MAKIHCNIKRDLKRKFKTTAAKRGDSMTAALMELIKGYISRKV